MSRTKGTTTFAADFEVEKRGPLDARGVVDTLADLILPATWQAHDGNEYTYVGMKTVVKNDGANDGTYRLIATDYTDSNNWVIEGGGLFPTSQLDRFEPITATDVTNGYLDLSQVPSATMHLDIIRGGAVLDEGVTNDYIISGQRITFSSGILVAGDKVIVKYYY